MLEKCSGSSGESNHFQLGDQETLHRGSDMWGFRPAETQGKNTAQKAPQRQWPTIWKSAHLNGDQWPQVSQDNCRSWEGQTAFLLIMDTSEQSPRLLLPQLSMLRISFWWRPQPFFVMYQNILFRPLDCKWVHLRWLHYYYCYKVLC